MTITLELSSEQEAQLSARAAGRGLTVQEYLLSVAGGEGRRAARAPSGPLPGDSTSVLLARWREEDATDDPEELARRDAELQQLMAGLNANRAATGERPLFPHERR